MSFLVTLKEEIESKKIEEDSNFTSLVVVRDGRQYTYPIAPNWVGERKLFNSSLKMSDLLLLRIAFSMDCDPKGLKAILPLSYVHALQVIDTAIQSSDEDEERHVGIYDQMDEIFQVLVDVQRVKLERAGVSSYQELNKKRSLISRFKKRAMKEYLKNPKNLEHKHILDLALLKNRGLEDEDVEEGVDIIDEFWALVLQSPGYYKRMKKIQRVFAKIWFETLENSLGSLLEKSFFATDKEISNWISKKIFNASKEFQESIECEFPNDSLLLSYIQVQGDIFLPTVSKKILTRLLETQKEECELTSTFEKFGHEKKLNNTSEILVSTISRLSSFDKLILKILEVDEVFSGQKSDSIESIDLSKLDNPVDFFLQRLIDQDKEKYKILNISEIEK